MANQRNKGDLSSLNKVWETKELQNFPRFLEAKAILDRVARTVAPVMLRRRWKVLMLKEFYPQQDGLLGMNVNRGETILLRLRPPGNKNEFYPWEHTIGTMIHELTHMEIGPHNSEFYKLMDEIADEVDGDQVASLSGTSGGRGGRFGSSSSGSMSGGEGQKLGGRNMLNGQDRAAKARAIAEATQARLDRAKLSSGSGQRLGGGTERPMSREELRQQAALAAQRRMRDDLACRHGQGQSAASQGRPAPAGTQATSSSSSSNSSTGTAADSVWICSLCDTANEIISPACSFCSSLKNDACYIVALDAKLPATADDSLCKPCAVKGAVVDLTDSPAPKAKQSKPMGKAEAESDHIMLVDSPEPVPPSVNREKGGRVAVKAKVNDDLNSNTNGYPIAHMRSCPQCTYMNHMTSTHCAICNTLVYGPPPGASETTASALTIACPACTYMNNATSEFCTICSQPL